MPTPIQIAIGAVAALFAIQMLRRPKSQAAPASASSSSSNGTPPPPPPPPPSPLSPLPPIEASFALGWTAATQNVALAKAQQIYADRPATGKTATPMNMFSVAHDVLVSMWPKEPWPDNINQTIADVQGMPMPWLKNAGPKAAVLEAVYKGVLFTVWDVFGYSPP